MYKLGGDIMLEVRELDKQRSVSLYKDQEEKLKKLNNSKLALTLIRTGVDLAIKEFEEKYGFMYDDKEERDNNAKRHE